MKTPDIEVLHQSFLLALRAQKKSPRTIETYTASIVIFQKWLQDNGRSTLVGDITRDDCNAFTASLLDAGQKPATVSVRYRSIKTFFRWAVTEDEIPHSPMATTKPPQIPDDPPNVIPGESIKKLLKACEGRDFAARRDTAILRLLVDSGLRRAELTNLTVEDVDLMTGTASVTGKGGRRRDCPFGTKTAQALDRYIRSRAQHPYAKKGALWLGTRGPLTDSGIQQVLERRAEEAQIEPVHLHQFRHTWAHLCKQSGMPEEDLMRNAGWSSRQMVDRYGRSVAAERARDSHKIHGPGDQF